MILKSANTILNELVDSAADVMEAKIDHLEWLAHTFAAKDDNERLAKVRADLPAMKAAVEIMREYSGSWTK